MTKKTKFFAIIAALAAIGFSLAGCDNLAGGNDNNNDNGGNNGNENGNGITPGVPTFTVTFYSAGGSAVTPQNVTEEPEMLKCPPMLWLLPAMETLSQCQVMPQFTAFPLTIPEVTIIPLLELAPTGLEAFPGLI